MYLHFFINILFVRVISSFEGRHNTDDGPRLCATERQYLSLPRLLERDYYENNQTTGAAAVDDFSRKSSYPTSVAAQTMTTTTGTVASTAFELGNQPLQAEEDLPHLQRCCPLQCLAVLQYHSDWP